jgi:predicted transcriptional regulator
MYDMDTTHVHRINARVDEATQRLLDELVSSTGQSASHVVRQAIAAYHEQVRSKRPRPRRLLAMVGRGRSPDGRTDVSDNYKDIVIEAIEQKLAASPAPQPSQKKKRFR